MAPRFCQPSGLSLTRLDARTKSESQDNMIQGFRDSRIQKSRDYKVSGLNDYIHLRLARYPDTGVLRFWDSLMLTVANLRIQRFCNPEILG